MLSQDLVFKSLLLTSSYKNVHFVIYDQIMVVDLIILPMLDFDIILDMNWLTCHQALLDCLGKKVFFPVVDG